MKVISRKEAKALNLKRYFTGKPCKNGHIAVRYTEGNCVECNRLSVTQHYLRHKDLLCAAHKACNRTLEGLVKKAYVSMKARTGGKAPIKTRHLYTGLGLMPRNEFLTWALSDHTCLALYGAWVNSAYDRKLVPSIDRIDTQRGYVRGNVQWLTLSDNSKKANLWQHYGINQITKEAA